MVTLLLIGLGIFALCWGIIVMCAQIRGTPRAAYGTSQAWLLYALLLIIPLLFLIFG